jgi:hypothetical protein
MLAATAEWSGWDATTLAPKATAVATMHAGTRQHAAFNASLASRTPRFAGAEQFGICKLLESWTREHLSPLALSYARLR